MTDPLDGPRGDMGPGIRYRAPLPEGPAAVEGLRERVTRAADMLDRHAAFDAEDGNYRVEGGTYQTVINVLADVEDTLSPAPRAEGGEPRTRWSGQRSAGADALLDELAESPLPGARYARDVVQRRLPSIEAEAVRLALDGAEAAFIKTANSRSLVDSRLAVPHYRDIENIWAAVLAAIEEARNG